MPWPDDFVVYAPPDAAPIVVEPTPRLESWMRHDHSDQVRLREYLGWLTPRVGARLAPTGNVLDMTIGLPPRARIDAGGSDLDNFLYPVVRALGHARFVSVWGSKVRAPASSITAAPAVSTAIPDGSWSFASAESSRPKDSGEWKADIDAQLRAQVATPLEAMLEVQIAYVLEPSWNWAALWKPTIDALGAVLGEGPRRYNVRDDRIVRLGLHRAALRRSPRRTSIGVWWRPRTSALA